MKTCRGLLVRKLQKAFTLLELLAVMAVMGVLLATAAPRLLQSMSSNSLTAAGQNVQYAMSMAQQLAISQSRRVELRFYRYERNGIQGYHAYQICFYDAGTGTSSPIAGAEYLSEGGVFIPESDVSPLLSTTGSGDALPAEFEPFASMNAQFRRIVFLPSGSLNLSRPLRETYLTLAEVSAWQKSGGEIPPNYYTVQIDPVTGRARSYRP